MARADNSFGQSSSSCHAMVRARKNSNSIEIDFEQSGESAVKMQACDPH